MSARISQPFPGSLSSSAPASASSSPSIFPITMVTAPERASPSLSSSSRDTPSTPTAELPQRAPAGRGGCWTCRVRRKKCDEEREGGSCRTCRRLTIDCLGWGAKRPEWMRDKQLVEQYKANIKAKLTRAGLIRGQPRTSVTAARNATTRPSSLRGHSSDRSPASNSLGLDIDLNMNFGFSQSALNVVGGPSNPFNLPAASYSDSNLASLDFGAPVFHYSPQPSSIQSESSLPVDFDMNLFMGTHNPDSFDFSVRPPSPISHLPLLAGQNSIQETHVMYFFEHVRRTNFRLAGNTLTNVTYSLIVQDPRGPVTNAVCALSSLHFSRMRVAQGLEAPDPNPEHSTAQYFHDEAFFQLASGKQTKGCHDESDVLAAVYLVCYSQMASTGSDWQPLLTIALDWIAQTGLTTDENPKLTLVNMSASRQLAVKLTMWLEIFSSFTAPRPPKYLALYRRLLGDASSFWGPIQGVGDMPIELPSLRMEALTGCPDDALLCIAEVSNLAHWKAGEQKKCSLSLRELLRRADEIEQRMQSRKVQYVYEGDETPLHPSLLHTVSEGNPMPTPGAEVMRLIGNMFREAALLYLHTTINDMYPAVPEIAASVETLVQLVQQLAPTEIDRALVFPICLSGCMTDDSTYRDSLKARFQSQDESIGNLMRARLLMEAVWQKRDTRGGSVDWREMLKDRCSNLLLI